MGGFENILAGKVAEMGLLAVLVVLGFRYFVGALERKDAQLQRVTERFVDELEKSRKESESHQVTMAGVQSEVQHLREAVDRMATAITNAGG